MSLLAKKVLLSFFILLVTLSSPAGAVYDPLTAPNNHFGVHILEPSELDEAAKLINSAGGQWGYVTIPIRSDDRDPVKWRRFFERAGQLKVIPIIRLATYVFKDTWATPTAYDLVDYANFLAPMPWPTKNRYVILFNEPNHAAEWGGVVDPASYAALLVQARPIFASRSADFFLLTAGLDMSAPTNATSLDALTYYRRMTAAQPEWINAIDGLAVHAYPNPGFSAPVTSTSRYGIVSYRYELDYLKSLRLSRSSTLPLFITETGHHGQPGFYRTAFSTVWTDDRIAAVTPFLLFAGAGDFAPFSLLDSSRTPRSSYQDIFNLPKTSGSPHLDTSVISRSVPTPAPPPEKPSRPSILTKIRQLLSPRKPASVLTIGSARITVEVADTVARRTQGLSGRPKLPPDSGMLFTFPSSHKPNFWMKGMLFGLDFVWINQGKVVGLTENVPPPDQTGGQPVMVQPDLQADWILELPAGSIAGHGIKVGDAVVTSP